MSAVMIAEALPVTEANRVVPNTLPNEEKWLPLAALEIPSYQRPSNMDWVEYTAAHFDPALLDRLLVNQRPRDPKPKVVDGHGRFKVLELLGWSRAPVSLHVGWTETQEMERYRSLNSWGRRKLSAYDLHVAGGLDARKIDAICERRGYILVPIFQNYTRPDGLLPITGVNTITRIFTSDQLGGSEGLDIVLNYTRRMWAGADGGSRSELLTGFHRFLVFAMLDRAFNDDHMITAFKALKPNDIVSNARNRAKNIPGQSRLSKLIVEVLRDYYNYNLTGEKRLTFVDMGTALKSHPRTQEEKRARIS